MRNLNELNEYRIPIPAQVCLMWDVSPEGDSKCGAFMVKSPLASQAWLRIYASSGTGWDHVSVSLLTRCPRWQEMEYIKRLFFEDDEVAMQLHVTSKDHINIHPNVLHLWRPLNISIPLPSKQLV